MAQIFSGIVWQEIINPPVGCASDPLAQFGTVGIKGEVLGESYGAWVFMFYRDWSSLSTARAVSALKQYVGETQDPEKFRLSHMSIPLRVRMRVSEDGAWQVDK